MMPQSRIARRRAESNPTYLKSTMTLSPAMVPIATVSNRKSPPGLSQ